MILALLKSFGGYVALALAVGFLWLRLDAVTGQRDDARDKLKTAKEAISELQLDMALRETASIERQADTDTLSEQARELHNARNHPGDDPDTRRLRHKCGILRQQSRTRFDATPACRRFAGEAGAGVP